MFVEEKNMVFDTGRRNTKILINLPFVGEYWWQF